jgi:hypothetical protein
MWRDKFIYALFIFMMIGLAPLSGQGLLPIYDIETFPVCYDSAGVRTNLQSYNLYVMGRSEPVFQYYIDQDGDVITPDTAQTVYDAPCWEVITEIEANSITVEATYAAGFTFAANTYDIVEIVNLGYQTHNILIDGLSNRLLPGERYSFRATLDPITNEWRLNPEIEITSGTVGQNNLRVHYQFK